MTDQIDEIASFDGRIAKVQGAARSGKTEVLVRRTAKLLADGVSPYDILVEVSSGFAADAFRERLELAVVEELRPSAAKVRVYTPLEACVQVLDTPQAYEATGRTPRLLTQAEYKFLLEDLRVTGISNRQLRKMLAYFYRCMEGARPEDKWDVGGEERTILDAMRKNLKSRGAMLVQEAPYICANYLASDEGKVSRGSYSYVLCDDAQNMSHAQQNALCLLAGKQVMMAGNPNEAVELASDNPSPESFAEFQNLRRNVQVFTLEGAYGQPEIVAYTDALCRHGDMDDALQAGEAKPVTHGPTGTIDDSFEAIKWSTPDHELDGLTKYILSLLDEVEGAQEKRTCVVVPNKRWAKLAEKVLHTRGYETSLAGAVKGIGGDPRDSKKAPALLAYTKLTLLAHPFDMTGWRSWCGFDHALTNSDAWAKLLDYAEEKNISLYDALSTLTDEKDGQFLRSEALAKRFAEGQEFISKNSRRKGFALMRAVGGDKLTEFEAANAIMDGDEDAMTLYELVRESVMQPVWPKGEHVMHIATYNSLCGCEYDNVFVLGVVDGYMPSRDAFEVVSTDEDRAREMNRDRRSFMSAVSKANGHLVLSYFQKCDLELAERTKIKVVRVRAEGGNHRMALVRPSIFLTEGDNATPSTTGGQALLGRYQLD